MRNILSSKGVLPLSYLDKYEMNKKWAECAYKAKDYDAAVNRYYYSMYQKILHGLSSNGIKVELPKGGNTHVTTIKTYLKELWTGSPKDKIEAREKMFSLKSMRHLADYESENIDNDKAIVAHIAYGRLDDLIT